MLLNSLYEAQLAERSGADDESGDESEQRERKRLALLRKPCAQCGAEVREYGTGDILCSQGGDNCPIPRSK